MKIRLDSTYYKAFHKGLDLRPNEAWVNSVVPRGLCNNHHNHHQGEPSDYAVRTFRLFEVDDSGNIIDKRVVD